LLGNSLLLLQLGGLSDIDDSKFSEGTKNANTYIQVDIPWSVKEEKEEASEES